MNNGLNPAWIPALIGLAGTIIGTVIVQCVALLIARRNRQHDSARDQSGRWHAMRTIVAERRIDAHQSAFRRIKHLLSARQDSGIINEAREWMDNNCLYLSPRARKAVWEAIASADARVVMLDTLDSASLEPSQRAQYNDHAMKHFNEIMRAFEPIVADVELPALAADELEIIAKHAQAVPPR